MASDVMSLFNMPTQEQLGQQYLSGLMASPAQIGSQGLLQQVVSLGGNAGAGLGYGVGRLLGGMTADEVRAKSIDDAMRTVQGMGLTSDADMYGALSQELAKRGLTQDALMARNTALKAAQTEQTMKTEQARLGIAQEELGLRKAADAREAKLAPIKIKALEVDILKGEDALKNTEQKLAESAAEIEKLNAEKPNSPELRAALGRYQGFARQLETYRQELAMKQEELGIRRMSAGAAVTQAQASLERNKIDLSGQKARAFDKPVYGEGVGPGIKGPQVGYMNELGQFQAYDGKVFGTRAELDAYVKQKEEEAAGGNQGQGKNKPVKSGTKPNPANYQ